MKRYLYIILISLLPTLSFAQSAPMKTKRIPVDTLVTRDGLARVVIFSNGTWAYVSSSAPVSAKEDQQKEDDYIDIFEEEYGNIGLNGDVFNDNWTENSFNTYKTSLNDLPSIVKVALISPGDSLGFHCPYEGRITSRYGYRRGRRHTGTDLGLHTGDPIYSAFDGKVRVSLYHPRGYGHLVIVRHNNGLETYYGHLSKRLVDVGETVRAGDIIGLGGSTGHSTGPHLHFETRYEGFPFDPERIIDFQTGKLRYTDFNLRKSYFGANSRYAASGNYDPETSKVDETTFDAEQTKEPEEVYHTVKSGENLSRIAAKYGTTVSAICKLNKIDAKKPLLVGKRLRVK